MTQNAHDDLEKTRLSLLRSYPLDREGLSVELNQLASVAAKLCNTPISLVCIVEDHTQRILGQAGFNVSQIPREFSFCAHAMLHSTIMIIPDATLDERFCNNPLVTGEASVRFYAGVALKSPEGIPLGGFCVIDTKPRQNLDACEIEGLNALATAAMALIENGRIVAANSARDKARRKAIDERDRRFQLLADSMPQLMWASDSHGMNDYYNKGWITYTGLSREECYGLDWLKIIHEDDRATAESKWRMSTTSGKPYEVQYRLKNAIGKYRWMLVRGVPITDRRGHITRWFGTCTDIHEHRRATDMLQILSRELNHRIKNIFAVIGGLVLFTTRQNPEFANAGSELKDRILALGRAHDFVRGQAYNQQDSSDLTAMLHTILAPYQNDIGDRILISGTSIKIDDRSATPLALFVHELATNAAKYGALSVPDGTVSLSIKHDTNTEILWKETGGPSVIPSTEDGFGAKLIEMSIVQQLGGTVEYDWRQDGLRVLASIPLSAMKRHN